MAEWIIAAISRRQCTRFSCTRYTLLVQVSLSKNPNNTVDFFATINRLSGYLIKRLLNEFNNENSLIKKKKRISWAYCKEITSIKQKKIDKKNRKYFCDKKKSMFTRILTTIWTLLQKISSNNNKYLKFFLLLTF